MKKITAIIFSLILAILASCTNKVVIQEAGQGSIPKWYLERPANDKNYIHSTASETSVDMEMAVNTARNTAITYLSEQIDIKIDNLSKQFKEQIGTSDNSEYLQHAVRTSKLLTSNRIKGIGELKKSIKKDGKGWRAYVLMRFPVGEAAAAFLKSINDNHKTYTQYKASKAYEELEKQVKEYEEFKKQQ